MAEILTPGKSDQDVIKDVFEKKSTIQQGRNIDEKQWLVNLAFLYGKQHFIAENRKVTSGLEERIVWELKSEERKNKVKRSSNYILVLYRSLLSRLAMMESSVLVEPTTTDEKDKSAAEVAQEVLEDHWQMVNKNNPILSQDYSGMVLILSRLFSFVLATGRGYLHPHFNPKTVSKAFLDSNTVDGEIGEVETTVIHQFNIYEDRLRRHLIEQIIMPVDDIKEQYNVDIKPEDIILSDSEQQLISMLEQSEAPAEYKDCVLVNKYWETPSSKHANGRFILLTQKKIILNEAIPPEYKNRIPYFSFNYLDLMLSFFPQGMVNPLISLQEEYNYTLTRLHSYKKWFAGKLKVPKKCKLETKYDDEIGQIIYYEHGLGEPHFDTPPTSEAVNFLLKDLDRIRRDMEDLAIVHDASIGREPGQVKSGVGIENLSNLDNSQLRPVLKHIEQKMSFYGETVLDIVEEKYLEPRLLAITGENLSADVATFKGENVAGNRRIKVNMGSALPASKVDRQTFLMGLADKGYIPRTKALELMEFGDLAGLYNTIDENAQKTEISEMLKGVDVAPQEWDYHVTHLKVLEDFLKGRQFKKLDPQAQKLLLLHRHLHQKFLQLENQAAAKIAAANQGGENE